MSRCGNPVLRHVTGCHRSFLFRARATVATALVVAFAGATPGAVACLYEDPSSASFQQGVLNFSYPKALYVRGAVIQARQDGILPPQPQVPITKDLFGLGYRKAAAMLHRFGEELPPQPNDDAFAFTLVLIEPMLWTRFSLTDGYFTTSVHVDGPHAGDIIVITAETVLQQIVNDRMSPASAEELGLIRLYGDASKFDKLRKILADRTLCGASPTMTPPTMLALPGDCYGLITCDQAGWQASRDTQSGFRLNASIQDCFLHIPPQPR